MKWLSHCYFVVGLLQQINTLKVSVYYEALCVDSAIFITQQLYPHYGDLANYIDLDLIPYGKASYTEESGNYIFHCQHGSSECRGNKYQSCVLAQRNGQQADVEFVNCLMRRRNPSNFASIEICAKWLGLDVQSVKSCSHGPEGDKLLVENGNKTSRIGRSLSFVPTIIYDDRYDDSSQWQSLKNFVGVVCNKITGTKPKICHKR